MNLQKSIVLAAATMLMSLSVSAAEERYDLAASADPDVIAARNSINGKKPGD